MRSTFLFVCFAVLMFSPLVSQTTAPRSDAFRDEPIVFDRSETTYRMKTDGTGERIQHMVMRIQSQGAAQQFGVLSIAYASAFETPHISFVHVRKPDGSTVDTPPDSSIEMPAEVTREAPLYSDLKEKHVAVRSLSVGDTLEYEVHTTIDKPQALGQFWGAYHFTPPGTVVVLNEVLSLELPRDKYVQVWSPNHKPVVKETDSILTYSWTHSQLVSAPKEKQEDDDDAVQAEGPKDTDEDAEGRKVPSVAWTTFHNWTEVGEWYRSMALPRSEPTESLRARGEDLTRAAKTPEDQIRAIYEYVSSKVRYIGIDFGIGRYQPHAGTEVLSNQYGDCKDKDTLLEALLKAKGFNTAPALIGAGIAPLPDVPTPAIFNHVITTVELPNGRIWLDSTPEVGPFGYLSAVIRDQKALVIPATGPATLVSTPAMPPYSFSERFEADATLDAEGKLTGKISALYRDDSEVYVRGLARNVAPSQWDRASQLISSSIGFSGTTSDTQFKNVDDLSIPVHVNYAYQRHPFGDWENKRILPLFPALEFPQLEKNQKTTPKEDIDLGAPRNMVAITHIHLPDRFHTDLPNPIHVKTEFATFDKTYQYDGHEITVERTINILKKKVSKEAWKSYQKFTKDISLESEAWIQLIPPPKPITIEVQKTDTSTQTSEVISTDGKTTVVKILPSPKPEASEKAAEKAAEAIPEGASAQELMAKAGEQLRSGDWSSARITLEAVKKKDPQTQYLWAMLGTVAGIQRDYEEAKTDFRTELKNHPDDARVAGALADVEKRAGEESAAQKTLREFVAGHPDELRLSLRLAAMEISARDYTSALHTLQVAADHHPDDSGVRTQLADTLYRLGRQDEAAAAAKSVLDDATDPMVINNAAYILSETGRDLGYSESMSRKAVEQFEEKTAAITTAEANSQAFADSNLLIASWDTLGWILFQEHKYDDARPLLVAAWRDSLTADVGDHLGQLYEAMDKKEEANAAYRLADAAANSNTPEDVRRHIRESFTRLDAAGVKPGPKNGTDALQNSRTYKIPKTPGTTGWGTFRMQLTAEGVSQVQQMSGESRIASLAEQIKAMKFAELVPPGSKAHLLRSAVVSCSQTAGCEIVLVPDGGLQTEVQ